MNALTTTPSPLLRAGAASAKWALRLLAFAWITLALGWGGLHFLIVPRIAELRPMLERQASRVLGATVRIGAITATSNGLIPSFELNNVSLLDGQGREALRLPRVVVALSPRSALNLGFDQLYVDGPVLDVRRTPDGRVWVAGFALTQDAQQDNSPAADWIFSQTELAIVHGAVNWTDEMRGTAPLALTGVELVLRNTLFSHSLRLDAAPPSSWGDRFSVMGEFKQPLLSRHAGRWTEWQGQVYASFPQVDLAPLSPYVDGGWELAQGAGGLRVWADVNRGAVSGITADVALRDVSARIDPKLDPLKLNSVSGRLGVKLLEGGIEYSTQGLQFDTQDGLHWPGGNVRLGLYAADGKNAAHGELLADKLDLSAMGQIANRLPLGDDVHAVLGHYPARGLVEQVSGRWQGPLERPAQVALKGRVVKLEIPARDLNGSHSAGFKGADIDFDITPAGGKASVAMRSGSVDARGIFDEPVIPFDLLDADVQWKVDDERLSVAIPNLRFANADAQGELQLKWQTADAGAAKAAQPQGRFPGVLDLQGSLSRAEANRVHRYLPTALDKPVRDYLRDAILGGTASGVKFKVKGNLLDFPFADPKLGEFRISAAVQNATYAYAPASTLPKDSLPWPALTQLSGDLLIDHGTLQVKGVRANLAGSPGLQIAKTDALISNLYSNAAVAVTAEARGPLADVLALVNASPLGAMTDKVLAHATATGNADYRIKLSIPLQKVENTTVQGAIVLAGNDMQITSDTPRLARTRGTLAFTESGFSITGGQARALGGDVRLEGGLTGLGAAGPNTFATRTAPSVLRIQGTASAEGLRQAKELGFAARLAQYASGSAAYTSVLGFRGGVTELQINTDLVGMALTLPAPFAKGADAPLPLRLETSAVRATPSQPGIGGFVRAQDLLQLDVGRLANITYVRDLSGTDARVLRGAIGVGLAADESAPLPSEGVVANISMDTLDIDAWSQVLSKASGANLSISNLSGPGTAVGMGYLPTSLAVRARELVLGGRKLNRVVVGGGREGLLWRANLDASELSGYVEYRQSAGANPGRLYARLARLAIGQSTAQDVESMLDEQPASIPALDIVVEDFELRGKRLGRVEIDAVNLGSGAPRDTPREWRLNRFNIINPEAVLTASGNWTNVNALAAAPASRNIKERRRTVMNFKLDIADAGDLLTRFGMTGVVRKGRGKIDGQIAWMGSPITLDYPSLGGNFNVNVETGQFLKADPGIAKLLGVLSLQALPRRLALDFRDVFSEGFSFDFFRGDVTIEQGIARTNNLQMKGVNAAVLMEGQADIARETQALKVLVVPEINAGSASLIASAINPVVGLTTFLAQYILRRPLMEAATQEFFIDGTWIDPRVTKVERRSTPEAASPKPEVSK